MIKQYTHKFKVSELQTSIVATDSLLLALEPKKSLTIAAYKLLPTGKHL
jgi:hypothetical protein